MPTDDEVYDFIDSFWKEHNVPPSVMEVRNGVGETSTTGVTAALNRMVEAGLLAKANPPTPHWVPKAIEECHD